MLLVIALLLSGCAVGRSWDTPDISDYETLPDTNESITIYTPEYSSLVKSALHDNTTPQTGPVFIKETSARDHNLYPRLTVKIEDPAYNNDLLYLNRLSFLTFSIIPGYLSESSRITLELQTKDDRGRLITQTRTYVAQRSFLMWLPLLPFANFGLTTMGEWGTSNTDAFWDSAYKYYIKDFILKQNDLIFRTHQKQPPMNARHK